MNYRLSKNSLIRACRYFDCHDDERMTWHVGEILSHPHKNDYIDDVVGISITPSKKRSIKVRAFIDLLCFKVVRYFFVESTPELIVTTIMTEDELRERLRRDDISFKRLLELSEETKYLYGIHGEKDMWYM